MRKWTNTASPDRISDSSHQKRFSTPGKQNQVAFVFPFKSFLEHSYENADKLKELSVIEGMSMYCLFSC